MKRMTLIGFCLFLSACDPEVPETIEEKISRPEVLTIKIPGPWATSVLIRPGQETLVAVVSHDDNFFEIWEVNAAREMSLLGRWDENVGFHPDSIHWVRWANSAGTDDVLILVVEQPPTVQLWRMRDQEVVQEATFPVKSPPKNAVATDFDLDGYTDLAVGPYLDDILQVLRSNGDFTFDSLILPAGTSPTNPSVVDWDQDGRPDLVWSAWKISQIILANNITKPPGELEFTLTLLGDEENRISRMVQPVDLNGDSFPDLIVPIENEPMAKIYFNDGEGGVADAVILPAPGPAGYLWATADGDGPQATLALSTMNQIMLVRRSADQTWEFRALPTEGFADDLDFADVDGDGVLDLLVTIAPLHRVDIFFGPLWERADNWEAP